MPRENPRNGRGIAAGLDDHDQLGNHLQLFEEAYTYGRRLKTLRGLTPYEFVRRVWTKQIGRFKLNAPLHVPRPCTRSIIERRATGSRGQSASTQRDGAMSVNRRSRTAL